VYFVDVVGKSSFGDEGVFDCITVGAWEECNGLKICEGFM
jgi:hypothetical protein